MDASCPESEEAGTKANSPAVYVVGGYAALAASVAKTLGGMGVKARSHPPTGTCRQRLMTDSESVFLLLPDPNRVPLYDHATVLQLIDQLELPPRFVVALFPGTSLEQLGSFVRVLLKVGRVSGGAEAVDLMALFPDLLDCLERSRGLASSACGELRRCLSLCEEELQPLREARTRYLATVHDLKNYVPLYLDPLRDRLTSARTPADLVDAVEDFSAKCVERLRRFQVLLQTEKKKTSASSDQCLSRQFMGSLESLISCTETITVTEHVREQASRLQQTVEQCLEAVEGLSNGVNTRIGELEAYLDAYLREKGGAMPITMKRTIVVIDDDAEALKATLTGLFCDDEVQCFALVEGDEGGIDDLCRRQQDGGVDAVLLNLHLEMATGGPSGWDVLPRVLEVCPTACVVIMSNLGELGQSVDAKARSLNRLAVRRGAMGFINKNFRDKGVFFRQEFESIYQQRSEDW